MSKFSPSLDSQTVNLITQEEETLAEIIEAANSYQTDRTIKFSQYHQDLASVKKQRLESVNWQEKNKLTLKLKDMEDYNPIKYLPEFNHIDSPYFASFSINDDNPRIGKQTFLLGKQSLFKENKVVIVDWRQSAISSLYYEYEVDEEYDEEINGKERTGRLTAKTRHTIKCRELLGLETAAFKLAKKDSVWETVAATSSTSEIKTASADHHLCDIVSLISPEQFSLITREYHGCLRLLGSAGAGKTTIALHRLSYLVFNYPQKFRKAKCLVLMFNRALRNYVATTVEEMLGPETPVETFHSWASMSMRSLGLKKVRFSARVPAEFDIIKKSTEMADVIKEYADSAQKAMPVEHLFRMYSCRPLISKYLGEVIKQPLLDNFINYYENKLLNFDPTNAEIGFADAGVLLRLFQIRTLSRDPDASNLAVNYFDHIVIDEAQDFSKVELECLFNSSSPERSLTICSDPNQQILNFVDSSGLENFQLSLQKSGVNSEELTVSYRSTREIMEVANHVLGIETKNCTRVGRPVFFKQYQDKDTALQALERTVLDEQEKTPNGLVAVICRPKLDVNFIYQKLKYIRGVRKEPQKFQPGILVTNAHQIKGLEFTAVILWNPSTKAFRHSKEDRNLLYVCLSRACDRLSILCHEPPTHYLESFF